MTDPDDRPGEHGQRRIVTEPGHEGRVDLDDVHRKLPQVGEGRVACTEVVDGKPDALAAEFGQPVDQQAGALDQHPLGDLEGERRRCQAGVVQDRKHRLDEPGRAHLPQREVHRHADGPAGPAPGGSLLACLAQHPVPERHDQA